MNVAELLQEEDVLKDLERIMGLRSTASQVSQELAQECFKWLTANGYRWTLHTNPEGIRYAMITAASFRKQAWNNTPGARERREAREALGTFGFVASCSPPVGNSKDPSIWFSPHVYFW